MGFDDYALLPIYDLEIYNKINFLLAKENLSPGFDNNHHITGASERMIEQVCEYFVSHLDKNIHIDEITEMFGCSRSVLLNKFKIYKGVTIHNWILSLKMQYADSLIVNTSNSIQEISDIVGFSSLSNFSARYKEFYSDSPLARRKKFLDNN
jgi:AraC family transcriptional regulator